MIEYKNLIYKIFENGEWKDNRTGIRTLTIPNQHFEFYFKDPEDIKNNEFFFYEFPLLTTKKMAHKAMAVELEGFIKGITDKQWYKKRGCNIWNEWANPEIVKSKIEDIEYFKPFPGISSWSIDEKEVQKNINDLGPIYGYQWRNFNKTYKNQDEDDGDFTNYTDQLKDIVDKLKNNPDDRRMVCSAWNPNQIDFMALPPCHYVWHLVHINGKLNLHWTQRSCDAALGIPFNIASYALLLLLLCKESGLKPGKLSATFGDCHIYENHIEGLKEQISRNHHPLPKIQIFDVLSSGDKFDIFKWTYQDYKIVDYVSHKKISFEVAV